jgi:hypothetical protein
MPDHRKRPRDPNQLGKMIIDIATGQVLDRQDAKKRRPVKGATDSKQAKKPLRAAAKKD